MANKKAPELRFKGYTQDWELCKFSSFVSRRSETSDSTKLPKVEFADIIAGEGRLNKDVSKKFDNRRGILFNSNNILYGKLRPYLKNWLLPNFSGIALGDFWVFEPINMDKIFLYYLLQAEKFQKIANDTTGTKMPRSDWKKVSNSEFLIPEYEEQVKIGKFLEKVDFAIALHQRKLEQLESLRKAYLQRMFPIQNKLEPELRFCNFYDDWELCELGSIGYTYNGLTGKNKDDFGHGDAKYIPYMNVFSNPIADPAMLESIGIDKKQNHVQYGDVLFTTSSETPEDVGMSSVWMHDLKNIYLNSFCFGFHPTIKIDPYYLAYMLRSNEIRKQFRILAQGISRYNIAKIKVMKIRVPIPHIEEQKLIGNLFKELDNNISFCEQKLEMIRQLKEAYLQKMFV